MDHGLGMATHTPKTSGQKMIGLARNAKAVHCVRRKQGTRS